MKKPIIKAGDIVHVVFLDHAQNAKDAIEFEVFGRVKKITPTSYAIYSWHYANKEEDQDRALAKDNEDWFCIIKKAIISIRKLK